MIYKDSFHERKWRRVKPSSRIGYAICDSQKSIKSYPNIHSKTYREGKINRQSLDVTDFRKLTHKRAFMHN